MYTGSQFYTQGSHSALKSVENLSSFLPKTWQAKYSFQLTQGRYTIKVADCFDEFLEVLELRRQIFLGEFSKNDRSNEHDFEDLDLEADFLIIKENEQIIATYRIISTEYSKNFYSATEFKLDDFLATSDRKIELSRACVKKEKRTGAAIHLLWRGIAAYMQAMNARYLFGCSSYQFLNLEDIISLYSFLYQEKAIGKDFSISPLPTFNIVDTNGIIESLEQHLRPINTTIIPPLLYGYVKAGAKVYGSPALDLAFSCLDFFTIFDINNISDTYKRKYLL